MKQQSAQIRRDQAILESNQLQKKLTSLEMQVFQDRMKARSVESEIQTSYNDLKVKYEQAMSKIKDMESQLKFMHRKAFPKINVQDTELSSLRQSRENVTENGG